MTAKARVGGVFIKFAAASAILVSALATSVGAAPSPAQPSPPAPTVTYKSLGHTGPRAKPGGIQHYNQNYAVAYCPGGIGSSCTVEFILSQGSWNAQFCYMDQGFTYKCLVPYYGHCDYLTCSIRMRAQTYPPYQVPIDWKIYGNNVSIISVY